MLWWIGLYALLCATFMLGYLTRVALQGFNQQLKND